MCVCVSVCVCVWGVMGWGKAAEMPAGSRSLERQNWCQKKEQGEKMPRLSGEVAVRGDTSQPRPHWKRCCSTASLSLPDPRKPGAAAFMLETLHLR